MIFALGSLVALPVVIALLYVWAWPGVSAKPVTTAVVGSVLGILGALIWLYWAALPLTRIGISGAPGGESTSLLKILGPRLAAASVLIAMSSVLILGVVSRLLTPRQ